MTNVKSYTTEKLLARVKSLSNFKQIPNQYWILGVRSTEDAEDTFDDKFYLFNGENFIIVFGGTTNPGSPALRGGFIKYNKKGSFVMRSGMWHYELWKSGLHKGILRALVQINKATGFRDGNKNGKAEEIGALEIGMFGINFHLNSKNFLSKLIRTIVGNWSHGCQVTNDNEKYRQVIELTKDQKSVSYCLLKEF